MQQTTEKTLSHLLMSPCFTLKELLQCLQLAPVQPDTAAFHATINQDLRAVRIFLGMH